MRPPIDDPLSSQVIAACIEVHRELGPGLLETIYESALCAELTLRRIPFRRQVSLPVAYKGTALHQTYRIDLIVGTGLIVEVKAVEELLPVHAAQVLTYLRLTGIETGLLVNFNSALLHHGLRRLTRTYKKPPEPPASRLL